MKHALLVLSFVLIVLVIFILHGILPTRMATKISPEKKSTAMQITSSAFTDNGKLPQKYTCEGEGINPPLEFTSIPAGAKSLALIVEDPDAVSKKPWIHWVLFNISPKVAFIKEGSKPSNSQEGVNDNGKNTYGPACPPAGSGVHRYEFRLYALDEKLEDMPEFTDNDMLLEAMHDHVLEQALLVGTYQNSKGQ